MVLRLNADEILRCHLGTKKRRPVEGVDVIAEAGVADDGVRPDVADGEVVELELGIFDRGGRGRRQQE